MELNLYQPRECDNYQEINKQILDHIYSLDIVETTVNFWNPIDLVPLFKSSPLFLKWIVSQDLKIKTIAVTVGKTLNCCGVHTDTPPARYKLSWPVLNAEQSYNRWFRPKDQCRTIINHLGGTSYPDMDQLEEIAKRTLSGPAIIDAGVPHDVQFHTDTPVFPRIVLQCQLIKEPTSL
jgi:hypothetical protein